MKFREYLSEIALVLLAVAVIIYSIACLVMTVGHDFFSDVSAPTPFLATNWAIFSAFIALIVMIVIASIRLIVVGGNTYRQASDEEKAFLRRLVIAIFSRVKQSDGEWGKRAKAAEKFYQDVKP
jgi:hypothetical protein